ncbi:MAG: GNAT family N-acetyltransferase, partial [Chitinophagaceae bacterium]
LYVNKATIRRTGGLSWFKLNDQTVSPGLSEQQFFNLLIGNWYYLTPMTITLRNGKTVAVRSLKPGDEEALYNYLQNLSTESRSRFGPHPFDKQTIHTICELSDNDTQRFIAIDESASVIVSYMLIKQGMIDGDQQRYARRNRLYEPATTVTYAPSVVDAWQCSGLGTAMLNIIEKKLAGKGIRHIVLWGGVQASNTKAVHFYKKNGYQFIASFWYDDKDNYDMVKEIV